MAILLPVGSILIGMVFWFTLAMSIITLAFGIYDLYKSNYPIFDIFGFGLVTALFTVMGLTNIKSLAVWVGFSSGIIGLYLPDLIK